MNQARHREIMLHAEVQFKPQWPILRHQHNIEIREARFRARQTNNSAAMLPAEVKCFITHVKAIVVARAQCIAEAYTAFNEQAGEEAEVDLTDFFKAVTAARKASFNGAYDLRKLRTGVYESQLVPMMQSFERDVHSSLVEGLAILNRQSVLIRNSPKVTGQSTKYVIDTCIFNWLADGLILRASLPSDGGFAITHIQVDEMNETSGKERRAKLHLMQTSLRCELLPTRTFLADVSRLDHSIMGDGKLFSAIKADLDGLNKSKSNNQRDALIAESAVANGYTLVTADIHLKTATERNGGKVLFFAKQ